MPAGGVEFLAAHLARDEAQNPHSIVVAAGDLIGAAPPISSLLREEPSIVAMNALHLSLSSVGNHEFDQGADALLRMQRGGCDPVDGCVGGQPFPGASFQYLSANVGRKSGGRTLFPATAVRTIDGVKVGFIGEVLTAAARMVRPSGVEGLSFADEASTANRYAAELQRQGVHAIVLLIHMGGYQSGENASDPNGCNGFPGSEPGFLAMLQKLTPAIRIVVSGHTHQAYNCTIDGRIVTSAASNGRVITRITAAIDRRTDEIGDVHAVNEVVTRDVPADPAETAVVNRYRPLVAARIARGVGSVSQPLRRERSAAGELPLGDVIADAQLAFVRAAGAQADVSFMNPGGVRADITGEHEGFVARGQVTYGDVLVCQPFGNLVQSATISGAALRALLEQQFHADGSATILLPSDGFTYTYRRDAPAGMHVVPGSIMLHGQPVAPGAQLQVVASDFLFDGGDGFTVLRDTTNRQTYGADADALAAYFAAHSPVSPPAQPRIRLAAAQ